MRTLITVVLAAIVIAGLSADVRAAAKQPNILLFFADDLGYGELSCQGNLEIPTPHIDSIAKNGIRFTAGYVAATYCSPSRAGLLTGRYPTRTGHEFNPPSGSQHGLALSETTIADRLKKAGYATAAVGKWHLGETMAHRPTRRGFDEFYGTLSNTPFFHPTRFVDSRISEEVMKIDDDEFYTTDKYAERAIDWLGKRDKGQPWFLYLPFNAQHAPLQAPQKYLDRFPGISDEKRRIFAAMLSSMDDAVGSVMKKVRDMGVEENTIVFFISDNGGPTASTTSLNTPLRGYKMTTWEGGPRVPFMVQWKGVLPAGVIYEYPVVNLDVLPTCLAAAGVPPEASWKLDGVDLMPYLLGKNAARPHETLYWRYGPQWAIRHGDMKLVVAREGSGQPELYDLSKDISEMTNLASAQPETVRKLQAMYDAWSAEQQPPGWLANNAAKKKAGGNKKGKKAAKK